jgi:hypothetical protein
MHTVHTIMYVYSHTRLALFPDVSYGLSFSNGQVYDILSFLEGHMRDLIRRKIIGALAEPIPDTNSIRNGATVAAQFSSWTKFKPCQAGKLLPGAC